MKALVFSALLALGAVVAFGFTAASNSDSAMATIQPTSSSAQSSPYTSRLLADCESVDCESGSQTNSTTGGQKS